MYVFRFGKFYEYNETYGDPSWSYDELLCASSAYASFCHYGIEESEAYSLSFMSVAMNHDPELDYPESFKIKMKQVFNHVEKA